MNRIKFKKGMQRKFIEGVLINSACPSLRELIERGFEIPYSTLKSYFNENRTLPEDFFDALLVVGGLNRADLEFEFLGGSWGQKLGGSLSRRGKILK